MNRPYLNLVESGDLKTKPKLKISTIFFYTELLACVARM
jgi:hypothetical protein